jgi:hypothetical protein
MQLVAARILNLGPRWTHVPPAFLLRNEYTVRTEIGCVGSNARLDVPQKKKNLVALPDMEPRLSGLLGRGVDAPKVTLRALIASIINRSKRKETYRHENLHGISTLLEKNSRQRQVLLYRDSSLISTCASNIPGLQLLTSKYIFLYLTQQPTSGPRPPHSRGF